MVIVCSRLIQPSLLRLNTYVPGVNRCDLIGVVLIREPFKRTSTLLGIEVTVNEPVCIIRCWSISYRQPREYDTRRGAVMRKTKTVAIRYNRRMRAFICVSIP